MYGLFEGFQIVLAVLFRGAGFLVPGKNLHHPQVPPIFEQACDHALADGQRAELFGLHLVAEGLAQVVDTFAFFGRTALGQDQNLGGPSQQPVAILGQVSVQQHDLAGFEGQDEPVGLGRGVYPDGGRLEVYVFYRELRNFSGQNALVIDQQILHRLEDISGLPEEEKAMVFKIVDSLLRDFKTRKAYAT